MKTRADGHNRYIQKIPKCAGPDDFTVKFYKFLQNN